MADENVNARSAAGKQTGAAAAAAASSAPQSLSDLMNDPAAQKNAIHPHAAAQANPAARTQTASAARATQAAAQAQKAAQTQQAAAAAQAAKAKAAAAIPAQSQPAAQQAAAAAKAARTAQSGSARPAAHDPHADAASRKPRVPKARRLKLSVTKVDPWSVAKVSFMLSIAFGIIQVVCACILWGLLQGVGAIDQLNNLVSSAGLSGSGTSSVFGFGQIISIVTIFSIFEVLLTVILSTIGAFLYNVVSMLVGGIHMTLGDD